MRCWMSSARHLCDFSAPAFHKTLLFEDSHKSRLDVGWHVLHHLQYDHKVELYKQSYLEFSAHLVSFLQCFQQPISFQLEFD